jgi:hypothetical protein
MYVYAAPDNPNCFDEKKFHYNPNNFNLKGGNFVLITTPVKVLNPVYLNSKLDPIKFTVNWYF